MHCIYIKHTRNSPGEGENDIFEIFFAEFHARDRKRYIYIVVYYIIATVLFYSCSLSFFFLLSLAISEAPLRINKGTCVT